MSDGAACFAVDFILAEYAEGVNSFGTSIDLEGFECVVTGGGTAFCSTFETVDGPATRLVRWIAGRTGR